MAIIPIFITAQQAIRNQGRLAAIQTYVQLLANFWQQNFVVGSANGGTLTIGPDRSTGSLAPQDQALLYGTGAQALLQASAVAAATLAQQSPDQTIPAPPANYRFGGLDGTTTFPSDGTAFLQQTTDGGTTWTLVPLTAAGVAMANACGITIPTQLQP